MSFYTSGQSVFDRLAAAETHSSSQKKGLDAMGGRSGGHSINSGYYSSRSPSTTPRSRRSTGTVSSSLFNRLANTETYATASMKGKIPSPPPERRRNGNLMSKMKSQRSPSSGFWHRMAYTDTFSTAQHKGKNDQEIQTPNSKRKTSNSFFHRMAYSETFATASKKGLVDESPKKTPTKRVTNNDFFDRMSKTDTYATASMKSVYNYGKAANTPTRKKYASPDIFNRLSKTDTKAFTLKKSSSWKKREEKNSLESRTKRNSIFKRFYADRTPQVQTPDSKSIRSVTSARSVRSTRSEVSSRSVRSSVLDYTSPRKPTKSSFVSRLSVNTKPKKPSPQKPKSTTNKNSDFSRQLSTRSTASGRLREEQTKARQLTERETSPVRASVRTSTTSSLSSFSSSKREPSISTRSTRSIQRSVPAPEPKPKPEPRPVLQFDSEDDLSFGDDSEGDDEFDLGGKPDEKEEDPAAESEVTAPQDDLSKRSTDQSGFIGAAEESCHDNGEKTGDEEIEVEFKKEGDIADEKGVGHDTPDDDFDEFSVETASIDDILGDAEKSKEETDNHSSNSIHESSKHEDEEYNKEISDNNEELDDILNDPVETADAVSEHSFEEDAEVVEEEEIDQLEGTTPIASDNEREIETDAVSEHSFEEDAEVEEEVVEEEIDHLEGTASITNDNDMADDREIDDAPIEKEVPEELDEILDEPPKCEELDDILDEPNEMQQDDKPEEDQRISPVALNESDDDISMGDESYEDEQDLPTNENTHLEEQEPQQIAPEEDEEPQGSLQSLDLNASKEDMKKSNTLDSLDFILDASSTIAEEPENEEEISHGDASIIEEGSEYDDEYNRDGESLHEDDHEMSGESDYEEEPGMEEEDDLPPLKYKLFISDKYHPEYGLEELYPDDLYLGDSLVAFEEGAISKQELAVLIIEALFERDFEDGEHWEIDDGTARDLEEDEGGGGELEGCAFVVKRQARLDWNDLYSVAAAKGTIIISTEKDEIKVENYSYFVAG